MPEQTDVAQVESDVIIDPSSIPVQGDVDQSGEPEGKQVKPQLSDAEKALIKARDENARKAREAEERARRLEEELYLRNQKSEPEEEIDPDMPMTYADYQKIEAKKAKKEQERRQQEYQQSQQIKIEKSVKAARENYKDSEFNYDWAYNYAMEHFSNEDLAAISMTSDPGETLYWKVMTLPENRDKIVGSSKQKIVEDTIDTIKKNLSSPGTLSNTGGADRTMDFIKQMDKTPPADFVKFADSVIKQKK